MTYPVVVNGIVSIVALFGFGLLVYVNMNRALPNSIGAILSALGGISFTGGLMTAQRIEHVPALFIFIGVIMIFVGCLKASGKYTLSS